MADDHPTIELRPVQGRTDLYHRYPGQLRRQGAYVWLDAEHRTLGADVNPEIGSAVPSRVWHGHIQRWTIAPLTADAANALLAELAPLAARVCAGYRPRWDGSNHVARYDADATAAIEAIAARCDRADGDEDAVQVWEAADWLAPLGDPARQCQHLGVTAATTDAELEALAERLRDEARDEGIDVLEDLDRYLVRLRDTTGEG